MKLHGLTEAREGLTILKNPFSSDKLTGLNLYCYISFGTWVYTGSLEFKNGLTKGEQKFEGGNPADVLRQMEAFIMALEGENA